MEQSWWKWAFDGIGGVAALALLGWSIRAYRAYQRRQREKPAEPTMEELLRPGRPPLYVDVPFPPVAENVKFTKPSPDEIYKEIDLRPVIQREEAARSYQGLQICWPALFRDVKQFRNECTVIVKYRNPEQRYSAMEIGCNVRFLPRLKIAKHNDPVIIRGRIVSVKGFGIWLDGAFVEFL